MEFPALVLRFIATPHARVLFTVKDPVVVNLQTSIRFIPSLFDLAAIKAFQLYEYAEEFKLQITSCVPINFNVSLSLLEAGRIVLVQANPISQFT